jgi:hypothetical protein
MFVDDHRPSCDCNFISHDAGSPLSSSTEKLENLRCCWLPGVERPIAFLHPLVGLVLGLQSLAPPEEISRLQKLCSQRISAWIRRRISYGSRFASFALAWHGIGDPIQEFKFPNRNSLPQNGMTTFLANFPERTKLSPFIDKQCEQAEDDLRQTKNVVPASPPAYPDGQRARTPVLQRRSVMRASV